MNPGDKVTTTETEPAYYSGYAGNPKQEFRPGMVGIFHGIVPAPMVGRTMYIVDFIGEEPRAGTGEDRFVWRVALWRNQIRKVK